MRFYFYLLFFLPPFFLEAQSFVRFYPGAISPVPGININSIPNCIEKTPDGGFLIGGFSAHPDTLQYDYMQLRKLDALGNIEWEKLDRLGVVSRMEDVVLGQDSTIYCAVNNNGDATVVKRSPLGDILWSINLNAPVDSCGEVNRIIKTKDDNYIICGAQNDCSLSTSNRGFVVKMDSSGLFLWNQEISIPWLNTAIDVIEVGDTLLYVTGFMEETDTAQSYGRVFLATLNSVTGQFICYKTYGDRHVPFSMVAISEDSIVVGGGVDNTLQLQTSNDGFLFLLSDTGALLSQIIDTAIRENYVKRIVLHQDFIYVLQWWSVYDSVNEWTSSVIRLLKYNAHDLSLVFLKTFSDYGSHESMDMEVLEDGRIAITFWETNPTCNGCTGLLVIDSNFCVPEWCSTGYQDVYTEPVIVYPNPFTDFFAFTGVTKAQVTLYDFLGRAVFSKKEVNSNQWIEAVNISDGIYFLELVDGNKKYQHKLIRTK